MRGRPRPQLVAAAVFEGESTLRLVAFSAEDEARLKTWLAANPHVVVHLAADMFSLLNDLLDQEDAG